MNASEKKPMAAHTLQPEVAAFFANVGNVQLDSLFVAEVPEPGSVLTLLGAGGLVIVKRRHR